LFALQLLKKLSAFFVFSFAIFLLNTRVLYALTWHIPEEIDVVEVNGKGWQSIFIDSKDAVELPLGTNRLLLQFKQLFADDYNDSEILISSKEFIIEFELASDNDAKLVIPLIDSQDQAYEFIKKPSVKVLSEGREIKIRQYWHGAALAGSSEQDVDLAFTSSKAQLLATSDKEYDMVSIVQKQSGRAQPKPLEMLKFWWQQASVEERQQFLDSLEN
jgi:uncharacterized protein YccT (UPF0319 family)